MKNFKRIFLAIFLITVALISVVAFLGFLSFQATESTIKDEFNQRQHVLAESTARGIEQYLETLVHQIKLISELRGIGDFDEDVSRTILRMAYDDLEREGINDIGVIDADGFLRFSANAPFLEGADFSFRNYFQEAKKATSPSNYFIELIEFKGADLGKKGVAVAVPIYHGDPSGTFGGVLLVTLPLEYVTKTFIAPIHESHMHHAFLIDKRYRVLWAADKSLFAKDLLKESKEFSDFQGVVKGLVGGKQDPGEVAYRGFDEQKEVFDPDVTENILFANSPVSFTNQEWFILIWTPTREALKLAQASQNLLLTIVGSVVLIILFSAGVTFVWIVRSTGRMQKAQARSAALNMIGREINSTLDVDQIMERVVKSANVAMGSDTTGIGLIEEDLLVVRYSYGLMEDHVGTRLSLEEAKAGGGAALSGKPVVIDDLYHDERVDPKLARKFSIRSFLGVPIIIKGESIGTLAFYQNRKPRNFTDEDIDFANKVAASVSLSLENAHLFQIEQSIADTLQEALLVMPKQLSSLDFGHLYRSSTIDKARVGGDFYDLFELDSRTVGLVVGDVSGKGKEAAVVTSMVKNTVKAFAREFGSPATVLAKTNDACLKTIDQSLFITLWFGVLDTKTGSFVHSNAGHPPPLIKRANGCESVVQGEANLPLGVLADVEYREDGGRLSEKDTMVLFTDGVIEARNEGGLLGEREFAEVLGGLSHSVPASELPALIIHEITEEHGYKLLDDVALVAVSMSAKNMETAGDGAPAERVDAARP